MGTKHVAKRSTYLWLVVTLVIAAVGLLTWGSFMRTGAVTAEVPPAPAPGVAVAADPTSVTLVGNLQDEIEGSSCGDWNKECADTALTEQGYGVWRGQFTISATTPFTYEYKAVVDHDWNQAYHGNHTTGPDNNTTLYLSDTSTVTFYYDDKVHTVLDSVMDEVAVAAGTFQDELGCAGEWAPSCVNTLLTDPDGDGIYLFQTADLPVGSYNFKVALNESWDVSYPGSDLSFTTANEGDIVTISWDSGTHDVTVVVESAVPDFGPDSVTLVGSLQSELGVGCGDWDPACAASHLTEVGNGVWRGQFAISVTTPTTYEYKMALNDSWDESYAGNHTANGNTSLYLTAPTTVTFYYDHKTHAVLDSVMDEVAVATGDFQDELGCDNDWTPSCVLTLLTDPDGDGTYAFQTTDIPAGSYNFKVALDEGWATAYPNDNVSLNLSEDKTNVVIYWDSNNPSDVSYLLQDAMSLASPAVTDTIQDEVFYFVMPDRFYNSDPTNDQGGIAGDRLDHGFDPTDNAFFHGGDLQGLIDKMQYLEDMGVTAIWMTPMLKNRAVQGEGAEASAGYHGYWTVDYTQADPHFGTNLELQQVITEAHSRGIKIFFDIIPNHTADVIDYQEGGYAYRNKADYPYRDANGDPFDDKAYVGTGTFPPLSPTVSFPYTPIFHTITEANMKVPDWLNNPIYYHNRGNVSNWDDPEEGTYGDFVHLDDLFTEHPDVVTGMIDIFTTWVDFGVDGFRVDTVKHVNIGFWQQFVPAILDHAQAIGNDDFFIFGEVYSGDKRFLSRYTNEGLLPSVLDFSFQGAANAYVAGQDSVALEEYFASDDYFIDADSNAYNLPTFLGNHDMGRFGYFLQSGLSGATDAELLARDQLGHALMYFSRGVPVVYYGDEQGFTGDGGDKAARQDMFQSQVPDYNDDDLIGTDQTTADENFDPGHPIYMALQEYADLYQGHKALRYGVQVHRYSESGPVYAFSRIDRDEQVEYVLAFNNEDASHTVTFPVYQAGAGFTAVYTAADAAIPTTLTSDASKQLQVTVPPLGFVIYEADAALAPSGAAPTVELGLQPGETLAGPDDHAEITATLGTEDVFAEVTFAVRVGTDVKYEVIGTDTNAPYRVFYDVSAIPDGTPVSIKAIVHDMNGHYASDQVEVVVGPYAPPASALEYAVIHYRRPGGDYGDWSSSDFNDFWGLHLWGEAIAPSEGTTWDQPKKFAGIDDFGAYVAIELQDATKPVNYIVHRGNDKDTPADRSFVPEEIPELWLVQGDAANYASRAEAQGYVTVHYTRTAGDFTGWGLHLWQEGQPAFTDWASPHLHDGIDDFGAYYVISEALYPNIDFTKPLYFIVHKGNDQDPNVDRSFNPWETPEIWLEQGNEGVFSHRGAIEDFAVLHYRRLAGDYGDYTSTDFNDFWGLHAWGGVPDPGWFTPYKKDGDDAYGVYFKLPLNPGADGFGYIIHRGDDKDPPADQSLDLVSTGYEIWVGQGLASPENVQTQYTHPAIPLARLESTVVGDLKRQQAYWVNEDTIAWPIADDADGAYTLHYDADAGLTLDQYGIQGGDVLTLTLDPAGLPQSVKDKFPHLADLPALKIDAADLASVPEILKSQVAIQARDADGNLRDATGLQIPGVLDDLYTYDGELGVIYDGDVPTLKVWAPTAQRVTFHLFDDALSTTTSTTHTMTYDPDYGVWSVTGDASWTGKYYLYEVQVFAPSTGQIENNLVTDPYAVSLSMNSARSQIVDLTDPTLEPGGWEGYGKPALVDPEDIVIYELHVRDFSVNDPTVPAEAQGTFKAFTYTDTHGMEHLADLADAGLTHLHLLPVFDIASTSINEDKSEWILPDWSLLASYPPSSTMQRDTIIPIRDQDAFNWGYDPLHYSVPEGSYSTNPTGTTRIVEFREMVQSLNDTGLRVVMDVVYNHTNASGQSDQSVLDRVVPGYYHRLNANGQVETSTCCANTATEHNMMEKLMIDSVVLWARHYKVDGFRFDLMGHHMKSNMLKLRAALDALTLEEDGVDGSAIYVYGEGWNFGEVANNARGVNATQQNMAGTGIGTFNDRLRDAVRGGGPFDSGEDLIRNQGFVNGLYYDPNALTGSGAGELENLLHKADQIRVGLAGNLADYTFVNHTGTLTTGASIDYNGSPVGYTADPQEHIVYVAAHDNQTLYDNNAYKMPLDATMEERVRAQNVAISLDLLAQGVPFVHAGMDMLRSKSFERDSYNSGDWFNKLFFDYSDNNFGVGLPVEGESDFGLMGPRLADPALHPTTTEVLSAVHHTQEMLEIRKSASLFRLESAAEVQERLHFHNTGPGQIPGLIAMRLESPEGAAVDDYDLVWVLFNATDEPQTFTATEALDVSLQLHPVQASGHDPVVMTADFDSASGTFTVPPRTTAVFVRPGTGFHYYYPVVFKDGRTDFRLAR